MSEMYLSFLSHLIVLIKVGLRIRIFLLLSALKYTSCYCRKKTCGTVKNSVLCNVKCKYIDADGCILINVTAESIVAKPGSIVYNIIDESEFGLDLSDGQVNEHSSQSLCAKLTLQHSYNFSSHSPFSYFFHFSVVSILLSFLFDVYDTLLFSFAFVNVPFDIFAGSGWGFH